MKNSMKAVFNCIPENESLARSLAAAFLLPLDPTIDELTEIKTAVSEAVSNAVIHAYDDNTGKQVSMECSVDDEGNVRIVVGDSGRGIADIAKAREPMFTTGDIGERSGMGFTVMESFMDKVEVRSEVGAGTCVIMRKRLDQSDVV